MRVPMIEARWATYIADDLRRAGHALDGPLKEVGLSRADVASPDGRIPYAAYMGLIERAALLLGEPGYGLKLGTSHGVRDSGLVGFIALNSPTLGDALANVERYIGVTNEGLDAVFESLGSGGGAALSRGRCADARSTPSCRAGDGPAREGRAGVDAASVRHPLRVEFTHERPNARIDYEGILGCPVRFQAEWDAVIFSEESLQLPVHGCRQQAAARAGGRLPPHRRPPAAQGRPRPFGARIRREAAEEGGAAVRRRGPRLQHEQQDARAPARRARGELSRAGRRHTVRPRQAPAGEHRSAPAPDRLRAGLLRAGAAGAGVQAVDRPDAHAIPPQASAMTAPDGAGEPTVITLSAAWDQKR